MEKEARLAGDERDRVIIRTSFLGIIANVFLAAFKAFVGMVSNSVAVTLDAVNNLSDALSSVITIVGTKLSGKEPDKKHPLGYGRVEYLTAMAIAAIVLYAGVTALTESVDKILHPVEADYSLISMTIIGSAVFVKLVLGRYVKAVGRKVNSGSLVASGTDALFDAVLSASVFASAAIFITTGIALEAYVGVLISVMIIRSAIGMFGETVDEILGKRPDRDVTEGIKATICSHEGVLGAYDLILHSYGPDRTLGSVHIEIDDTMSVDELDVLERSIAADVMDRHGVILTGIGIYSRNTSDDRAVSVRTEVTRIAMAHEGVLQMHGFRADAAEKTIVFDLIIDYAVEDREALLAEICGEVRGAFPDYDVMITPDIDL